LHAATARRFAGTITHAIDAVTRSSSGTDVGAARRLRSVLERRVAQVRSVCETTPPSLRRFQATTAHLTRPPLDRARQRQLVAAYGEWARPLGATTQSLDLEGKLGICDRYDRGVHASYAVHTEPTSYGKNMWVTWTVRNDTDERITVSQAGALWARGIQPSYPGDWDRKKQAWLYTWGGSSADPDALVRPGSAESARAGVVLGYLPMRPDGQILEVVPDLLVYPAGRAVPGGYCWVHAAPAP